MAAPIYLFEDAHIDRLYPLTLCRSPLQLLCGAQTILERAKRAIGRPISGILVRSGIAEVLKRRLPGEHINPPVSAKEGVILINARALLFEPFSEPIPDSAGLSSAAVVWMHLSPQRASQIDWSRILEPLTLESVLPHMNRQTAKMPLVNRPWDLLEYQKTAFEYDFKLFGPAPLDTQSKPLIKGSVWQVGEPDLIHIAANVKLHPGVVIDASSGPVIIESGSEIRAHAVITGPCYIGPNCIVRDSADVRQLVSLGQSTRVGGEVIHSIFLGYGNKQHYGFVGQCIFGEWTNLGAGATTSNLKNTYGTVRMPINGVEEETGRQFLGSVIADHAKIGIGTFLSTGSVVGFSSHVTAPRPAKFTPSFAWVSGEGKGKVSRIEFEKTVEIAKTMMHRRGFDFTQADHDLFVRIATDWSQREKFDWESEK